MARGCFCGCGRKIGRQHKQINKRGAEIQFLCGVIESHWLPFQDGYVLFTEQGEDVERAELEEAREGAEAGRELIDVSRGICGQVATAIHEDDPDQVRHENLEVVKQRLVEIDAHTRTSCTKLGLKYDDLPALGPQGIADFVRRKDREDRARLRLPD